KVRDYMQLQPDSEAGVGRGTAFAFAFLPRADTATEASDKEQANMATANYTHDAALTEGGQEHTAFHDNRSLSWRVEAVGRELARYGLVVVVGWIGFMKFTGDRKSTRLNSS